MSEGALEPETTEEAPVSPLPNVPNFELLAPEVQAALLEDPGFVEVMARARAKIRQEEYRSVHTPDDDEKLEELLANWESRGSRYNPYLRGSRVHGAPRIEKGP